MNVVWVRDKIQVPCINSCFTCVRTEVPRIQIIPLSIYLRSKTSQYYFVSKQRYLFQLLKSPVTLDSPPFAGCGR